MSTYKNLMSWKDFNINNLPANECLIVLTQAGDLRQFEWIVSTTDETRKWNGSKHLLGSRLIFMHGVIYSKLPYLAFPYSYSKKKHVCKQWCIKCNYILVKNDKELMNELRSIWKSYKEKYDKNKKAKISTGFGDYNG